MASDLISVAYPIYAATKHKGTAVLWTFAAGLTELLGAVCAWLFFMPILSDGILGGLYGLSAGIMLALSLGDLLPDAAKTGYKKCALAAFAAGGVFMTAVACFL